MSKKIGNKQLAIILIVLVAIYGISKYISNRKGENTFHTAIMPHIDSAKVTSVIIFTKAKKGHPIRLEKKGKIWMASQDDITSLADQFSPKYVVQQLKAIDPDRLATADVGQWKDYEVSDTAGTRIVIMEEKDTMLDVIVGKFGFMPERRQGISYVRLNHQKEVYGVEGFLSMNIAQDFDSWRDRKIIPSEFHSWTMLTYTYPADSGYSVKKDSTGKWRFNDGALADSTATANNLSTTSQQNYGSFVNKFDTNAQPPLFTLKIDSKDAPVILKAYAADTANKYVITSSMIPGSYFSGAKASLFSKIFLGKKAFFHHDEPKKPAAPNAPRIMRSPVKGKK